VRWRTKADEKLQRKGSFERQFVEVAKETLPSYLFARLREAALRRVEPQ